MQKNSSLLNFSLPTFVPHCIKSFYNFFMVLLTYFLIKINNRFIDVTPLNIELFSVYLRVINLFDNFSCCSSTYSKVNMKNKESHHRQCNHSCSTHCHNNHNRWVYWVFTKHGYNCVNDQHYDWSNNTDQEKDEKSIISFPNAVVDKGTVMVKYLHTVITSWTVTGPMRSINLTGWTVLGSRFGLFWVLGRLKYPLKVCKLLIFWFVLFLLSFNVRPAGYDARVSAPGQIEEQCG